MLRAVCLLWAVCWVRCYDILALFPHASISHLEAYRPLLDRLASRGHNVTVVSFFPRRGPEVATREVSLAGLVPPAVDSLSVDAVSGLGPLRDFYVISRLGLESCEAVLGSGRLASVLAESYDLVLVELFTTDCFLSAVDGLRAPFIGISSSSIFPTTGSRLGNPENPAYVPNMFLPFDDNMPFWSRVQNTVVTGLMFLSKRYYFDREADRISKKYLGDSVRPIAEIATDTSLIFSYRHYTLNGPIPLQPTVVEVGGLHVGPAKPLPQDIETFINGAKEGVIYFSLGSSIRAESLSEDKRKIFVEAFSRISQRVLWKYEGQRHPDVPDNVIISKWFPQRDVLGYRGIRLVITHGGMLTITEAVYCGIPIIGIPFFGDQGNNMAALERTGSAIVLQYESLTSDVLLKSINRILHEKSFKDNALALSVAFKDRPSSPLSTAIYWCEYVARHKKTPFSKAAAARLDWHQGWLWDVTLVLFALVALAVIFVHEASVRIVAHLGRRIASLKWKNE
ncbi:hypothetical protein AAG570_012703 [Ranatra chinensis]|uniref:UDP-glucuronosyltransferase n=1 Tax=Ranatra chinensis TaxID=642074 RepID=A0ABD0YF83_9HEMI